MTAGRIAVVVPVLNKHQLLKPALHSILEAAARDGGCEICCLDHGSTDGSREILLGLPGVSVLGVSGGNIGFLRNEGARRTTGAIISFLDSDVLVEQGHFVQLRAELSATDAAAIGCECTVPAEGHWTERVWHQLNARRGDGRRHYLNAANIAVRREVFELIGGFSESLVTAEDTDLCRRLRACGFAIEQRESLAVVHLGNPKSLRDFFAKEIWRGVSNLDAAQDRYPDRIASLATAWMFSILSGVALAIVALIRGEPRWLPVAVAVILFAPGTLVLYRIYTNRRIPPILRGLILASIFLTARFVALVKGVARGAGLVPSETPTVTVLK